MNKRNAPEAPAFITRSKYQKFCAPDRYLPRTLVDAPPENGRTSEQSVELNLHVKNELRRIVSSAAKTFTATCITVVDDDGMSWSAESINALVTTEFPHFKRWFEEIGERPAVKRGMAAGADLSVDVSKLPSEEQARIRRIMYNQRAIPVAAQ